DLSSVLGVGTRPGVGHLARRFAWGRRDRYLGLLLDFRFCRLGRFARRGRLARRGSPGAKPRKPALLLGFRLAHRDTSGKQRASSSPLKATAKPPVIIT